MQNLNKKKKIRRRKKELKQKKKFKEFIQNLQESFSSEIDMNKRKTFKRCNKCIRRTKECLEKIYIKSQRNKRVVVKKRGGSKPPKFN